jgi:hypothetical protein
MRIRIQAINFDADPDADLIQMRIQVTKTMRILADPDPKHWGGCHFLIFVCNLNDFLYWTCFIEFEVKPCVHVRCVGIL